MAPDKKKCGQMAMLTLLFITPYLLLDAELLGNIEVWKTTTETNNSKRSSSVKQIEVTSGRPQTGGERINCIFLLNSRRQVPEERTETGNIVAITRTVHQGRIKLFGAPRQWKNFRPLFQAVFLWGGGYYPPDSQTPRLPVPRQK